MHAAPRFVTEYSAGSQLKGLVPGNHLMVDLLGQRDELLKVVEAAFPTGVIL